MMVLALLIPVHDPCSKTGVLAWNLACDRRPAARVKGANSAIFKRRKLLCLPHETHSDRLDVTIDVTAPPRFLWHLLKRAARQLSVAICSVRVIPRLPFGRGPSVYSVSTPTRDNPVGDLRSRLQSGEVPLHLIDHEPEEPRQRLGCITPNVRGQEDIAQPDQW